MHRCIITIHHHKHTHIHILLLSVSSTSFTGVTPSDYGFIKKTLYMPDAFPVDNKQRCLKAMTDDTIHEKLSTGQLIDLVKVLHLTRHKIGYFGDALLNQSLGVVLRKQKSRTRRNNHKNI